MNLPQRLRRSPAPGRTFHIKGAAMSCHAPYPIKIVYARRTGYNVEYGFRNGREVHPFELPGVR